MNIQGIDEIDNRILDEIKDNARLSYSEIGEKVGISRVSVKNRIEALCEKKIIKGFKTIIDETSGPNGIKFFLDIEADPVLYDNVIDKLAMFTMIRQIYSSTGSSRIHAMGYVENKEKLDMYVKKIFGKIDGVKMLVFHMVLNTYKDTDGGVEYVRYQEPECLEGDSGGESAPS